MRGPRPVAVSTLAEEPAALIGHGGVCEGEESMSTACRLLSTRKPPIATSGSVRLDWAIGLEVEVARGSGGVFDGFGSLSDGTADHGAQNGSFPQSLAGVGQYATGRVSKDDAVAG